MAIVESTLSTLKASLPGRESQIQQLSNLFGHPGQVYPDSIYIHGGQSVGKSLILKTVLTQFNVKHAVVNLIECYTTKILLESILYKLVPHTSGIKCDNLMDFTTYCQSNRMALNRSVIVFDKAEKLRTMDFNLLPALMRLRELTGGVEICTVFLSELVFQKFYPKGNYLTPIQIHFPQYSRDELLEILALDVDYVRNLIASKRINIDSHFYRSYLHTFLSVFFRNCRDLSELRYMARKNFPRYCEPIVNGENSENDSMALWKKITPHFKEQLQAIYLRTTSEKQAQTFGLELPFYGKYLLIAAYLASYNPAKDDKKFFMRNCEGVRRKKTVADMRKHSKVSEKWNTQLGPKPFSFDRLLAIFYAIQDDKIGFNNNLLVQVSSLVELKLLSCMSDGCTLDSPRYKCNVNFEFIQQVAKMVGFNIRKYLSDFGHI